jgi:hypothetical protein
MPSYLSTVPAVTATDKSPLYGYVRLGEFQNLDQLGRDVVHPWHNLGHGAVTNAGFPLMAGLDSPGSKQNVFWRWHTTVDGPRLNFKKDLAKVISRTPDAGTTVTGGPTQITIAFDKKVSSASPPTNTIQLVPGALTVNGSAATMLTDAGSSSSSFMVYTFSGFTKPGTGKVTVKLSGTASYEPKTWEFTVK